MTNSESSFDDAKLDEEALEVIRSAFEENIARFEEESSLRVNAFVREQAYRQVVLYWKKLKKLALSVTEAEVRLVLPGQESAEGKRRYNLEGVVDIVCENGKTMMYDVKTHDPEAVRANRERYGKQLNVYAKIFEGLRGKTVDGTAVIATSLPPKLRRALAGDSHLDVENEIKAWQPVIDMDYSRAAVDDTIREFGTVVDGIEGCVFDAPGNEILEADYNGQGKAFAVEVCRNCDARFTCSSYRAYAQGNARLRDQSVFALLAETGDDIEADEYRNASFQADDENRSTETNDE